MENVLQEENHQVILANVVEDPPSPKNFDSVFIGSSIHINKYNLVKKKEPILNFINSLKT